MPHDRDISIGLYMSSPIPVLVYRLFGYTRSPPEEPKVPVVTTEDPTAPTPDEPSAV